MKAADYERAAARLASRLARAVVGNRLDHEWCGGGSELAYAVTTREGIRRAVVDVASGAVRETDGDAAPPAAPSESRTSPDGRFALLSQEHDLWLRDLASGTLRRLTHDGEPDFAYGKLLDDSTLTLALRQSGGRVPPAEVAWSPDSRRVIGVRNDERSIEPYPFVEWAPKDGSPRPKIHQVRITLLGEAGRIRQHPFIIDVPSGQLRPMAVPSGWRVEAAPIGWSDDAERAFLLATSDDRAASALLVVEVATGEAAVLLEERAASSSYGYFRNGFEYSYPNVRILDGGRSFIWYSQGDGVGRLYLHDGATGERLRDLTPGPGVVIDIISVDEARRRVLATVQGRDVGRDPYQRDLYAFSLDGDAPLRLTPDDADHEIAAPLAPFWAGMVGLPARPSMVSPDGGAFVDVSSTVDQAPTITLRSTVDGRAIAELSRGDVSAAEATGWRPPTRFKALAADGKTELWGVIHLPDDYTDQSSYPVVDALYAGPQITVAPRNFNEAGPASSMPWRASLAALGFIVFTVDGRGTPGRDLAFWEAGYGDFAEVAIADHAAVLEQLADRFTGIDRNRVGVIGHSFGGYVAARAMLRRPDLYKVGVSSAAVHNWEGFRDAYEQYEGVVDYGGGVRVKPAPTATPAHYLNLSNAALADRLEGKLLLAYADLDENAVAASTLQFIDALVRANKSYDLLYLPNRTHAFSADPYFIRRAIDYLVEHLIGAEPPTDFSFA